MPIAPQALEAIRVRVWSGFDDRDRIEDLALDLVDEDDRVSFDALMAHAEREFARKAEAEATWPAETDWDRLDRAFAALDAGGIIALHDEGISRDEGLDGAVRARVVRPGEADGFCLYQRPDVEAALRGDGLSIGYGAFSDPAAPRAGAEAATAAIGRRVEAALRDAGFTVAWNGDPGERLLVKPFAWRRRTVHRPQVDGFAPEFVSGPEAGSADGDGPPASNAMPIGCLGGLLLLAIVLHLLGRC